jgi:winged helix DNA-binding protein
VKPAHPARDRESRAVVAERLTAQLLAGAPAGGPLAVAERLLAIQGQDPRGARLAIRARSAGVSAADIDHALSQERSMLITWVNRGTLHLIRSEDYPLLHALTTPQLRTGSSRRLAQEGIEPKLADRALAVIERAIASDGPLTRHQLRERLQTADIPVAGQAFIQLLYAASLRGVIVRGPMAGREHAYALVRDWLPSAAPVDRDRALAELARRYLAGHGPASDRDLARWAALPLRDARAGLAAIAGELRDRGGGLLDLARRGPAAEMAAPRLLGAFEPLLLGWRSRKEILGPAEPRIVSGGIFRAFALVDGRAVARWRIGGAGPQLEPFGRLRAAAQTALELDYAAVVEFLGE